MATTRDRRRHRVTQTQYPQVGGVAQPISPSYLSVPQPSFAWGTSANFVHTDPMVDNSHDSLTIPPPATLTLIPPTNDYITNTNPMLYSPSSDGYSQTQTQEQFMLPSYGNSFMEGINGNGVSDWSGKIENSIFHSPSDHKFPLDKFESAEESEVKIKDLIHSHSTSNMTPKQRAAHRKVIEEKSSMKRKLAEQRLSKAVTTRLGGTFVPGLANQMNQAADIIEKDAQTIRNLEAELDRLRRCNTDVQMKYRS